MRIPGQISFTSDLTISDVAQASGVSVRTVSRVLNQSPLVNTKTRERVLRAINELNFKPSLRARALAMGRSLLIGMVHNDWNALSLDAVQRGITREATPRGYELITHSVAGKGDEAIAEVLAFSNRVRLDGLIVLQPVSGVEGLAHALQTGGIQAVAISAVPLQGYGAVVISRERSAAAQVAKHLIESGHTEIGLINGPQSMISARERRLGFVEGLNATGVTSLSEIEGDYTFLSGVNAAHKMLSGRTRPTAIFAANEHMAAGVLKIAAELGISVPGQLSVIGFDGSILADMVVPSLTTVYRPWAEIAGMATNHLLDLIEGLPLTETESPPLTLRLSHSSAPAA